MSSGGGGTNTTTSSNAPPPQFTAAFQDAVTRAQQVASQPRQSYPGTPGSLVAGFSPDQQAAIGTIQNAQGIAAPFINAGAQEIGASTAPLTPTVQPFVNAATGYYNQAGAPVTQGDISRVENPFTKQVVNATQAEFDNQNAQRAAGIRGNAISSGAFGGDREGVAQGIAAGQEQLAQAPVIAGLNQSGFNTALQNAMQQKQLDLGAGQGTLAAGSSLLGADEAQRWLESQAGYGLGNLGNEALNSTLTGANAQLGVGGLEQQLAQENLNVPYSDFIAQQAYPFQSTGWLANIEEGLGSASGGTSSTTYPGPSGFSQVAGAGLAGAGLLQTTGAFGSGGSGGSGGGGGGWLSGLFGGGGGGVDTGNFDVARGGRVPHRAAGGIMPVSALPPMGAGVPGGAGIPDLSVDFIPGGKGGGRPLITGNYGTTSTSDGGGGSDAAGALGTIASIAKIVSLFQRGGGVPHRARGGIADFANDDFANDNRFEPPRKRAAGGITVDIPQMQSNARGISYVPGGNGIAIPQFNVPGGSGPPPSGGGGGGIAGVNDYLARTQAMAPSAASIAALAPRPMPMPMMAPAPAAAPAPVERFDPPSQGGQDSGGGDGGGGSDSESGGDSGGGDFRGGRVPHRAHRRAPGGVLPAWAGGPPDISLPTAPDVGISDANTSDWRDDPANPVLGAGAPAIPDVPDTVVTAPHARHGMLPPSGGIAAASLPEPPIPPDQAPGGGGIAAQTATTQPAQHDKPSSKWGEVLLAAGLGMMGGTSPNALTNIGRGGLEGLKFGEQQRMREEQAELRRLQQEDLSTYRKAMTEDKSRRTDIYGDTAQNRASLMQAQAALDMARSAHLGASHATEGDILSTAVNEYVKANPQASRADALRFIKGVQDRADAADRRLDQGDRRLDQGDTRLGQGDARLDIQRAGQAMTAADHAQRAQARADAGEDTAAMRMIGAAALQGKTVRYTDALAQVRSARGNAGPAPLPGASGGGGGAPAAPAVADPLGIR